MMRTLQNNSDKNVELYIKMDRFRHDTAASQAMPVRCWQVDAQGYW
ncbi:hypothetical protein H4O21_23360 [Oceanospirillum sp. D5]|uniref:Uncharacterized protein n=1 Tax=Oceanospirillum sediminis TaxID=2760088 RepID=A0A839IXL5_9GAMM|nr:hypothetical protein [Oceanospirillum sediminis]